MKVRERNGGRETERDTHTHTGRDRERETERYNRKNNEIKTERKSVRPTSHFLKFIAMSDTP